MGVQSVMQEAEIEIRELLTAAPGEAMTRIIEAYNRRPMPEKEAFVLVLATRVIVAESMRKMAIRPSFSEIAESASPSA